LQGNRFASRLADGGHDVVGFGAVWVVGENGTDAALGAAEDGIAAKPPAAAGDNGNFTVWE